jgi:uncharacterized lipoprotein YddW (UPF0748 family)
MRHLFLVSIFCFFCFINGNAQSHKREMRGVWIATVANIDWPSRRVLTPIQQRNEMRAMLDEFQKNKINTIVIQIRPTADAFYASMLEPWSYWLTNEQGAKPNPYYDPLHFIIEEAHKRCIDVHAWLNPYRVLNDDTPHLLNKNHLFFKKPELFVKYGGKYYFNPALDETRQYLSKVVEDIVERYDIDAIHFDDYFYPYKVSNEEFPDEDAFKKYPRGFAPNQKDDWRRNNVNLVIAELQKTIKSIKPWVEFGISPFGVWRNNNVDPSGSATRAGVQNYDDLYADILKWLREGSIDYVAPQLYWEIGKKVADYEVLVEWWSKNSYDKNLYIGLYPAGLGDKKKGEAWTKGNEIVRQLNMNKYYPKVDGVIFYSAKHFVSNKLNLNDSLQQKFYKYPAISPINRNILGEPSAQPQNLRIIKDGTDSFLMWDRIEEEGGCQVAYYVVYAFKGKEVGDMNDPSNIIALTTDNCLDLDTIKDRRFKGRYAFVVTAINRYKHESKPTQGVTRKL